MVAPASKHRSSRQPDRRSYTEAHQEIIAVVGGIVSDDGSTRVPHPSLVDTRVDSQTLVSSIAAGNSARDPEAYYYPSSPDECLQRGGCHICLVLTSAVTRGWGTGTPPHFSDNRQRCHFGVVSDLWHSRAGGSMETPASFICYPLSPTISWDQGMQSEEHRGPDPTVSLTSLEYCY